jgi:glycosyltransferase involved in cell wall biosynthesis
VTCDLAVIILTFNEALHIERAIAAVRPASREIFVIDAFSTDGTAEIAARLGATVLQNRWINYSKQFAWALENAPIQSSWVMRLDADEIVEPDLAAEIMEKLPDLPDTVAGINLNRKHIFLGRWIKHGGRFPLTLLRIWRRGQGRIEDRWMDEHMAVWGGRTILFKGGFADHNLNDLTFFTAKHNGYATREAIDILIQKHALLPSDEALTARSASRQASAKRSAKLNLYNRLPFWVSSSAYFLYRYILQLGFLDGREGLIYHFLQGYWYRFLVGAKVVEFERAVEDAATTEQMLERLAQVSGLRLSPGPSREPSA